MRDKFFIDTNIILYMYEKENNIKYKKALSIIKKALDTEYGVISYQVIQECCNALLKKFKTNISVDDCRYFIGRFLYPICEVFPGFELYESALDIKSKSGYSFYDSLIIASALQSGCNILYTEDMQHGQQISGIKIINPFITTK